MQNPLIQTIEALAKEKGIEADTIISAIEDAVLTASRKYYKTNENLKTRFNTDTGQVDLFAIKHIVQDVTNPATEISLKEAQELYGEEAEVDMEIEFPKRTDVLGRIAAQTAKQVIFQKVREAERENIFTEFSQRVGEVQNGTVKRFENGDLIVEIGRNEAVLPRKEQSRAESYTPGERLRAVIKGVNRSAKGPQIVLSRTDPALLIKLFEQEVPEIYDGTVMIRGAVREAGDRAKVAVYSRERDVDPVGACVGMKGTRVQSIIRELRGQTDVLPLLADREGQLFVFDDHFHHLLGIVHDRDPLHLRGTDRIGDEDDRIFGPLDDVDFLTAQFADDRLDAGALHAHAGADRVHVTLPRIDRDFGAITRLTYGAADHDGAVVDFRHFLLEQFDQQRRIRSRQDDLRTLGTAVDPTNDGPHPIADVVVFGA